MGKVFKELKTPSWTSEGCARKKQGAGVAVVKFTPSPDAVKLEEA